MSEAAATVTSPLLETRPLDRLTVVLVSPRNTLNIGAVARAMSNFGASDLRVANIYYKEFRSATSAVGPSSALLHAARDYPTTEQAIRDAHLVVGTSGAPRLVADAAREPSAREPQQSGLQRLEQGALRVRAALDRGERVALLFGSEKFGLSSDDLSHCHLLLRIPTREQHPSMNLGQAAALCLYELARIGPALALPRTPVPAAAEPPAAAETPAAAPATADPPAAAEAAERLTTLLADALLISGHPGAGSPARARQLRAFVRRLRLSGKDAELATGFLRQMLWSLHSGKPGEAQAEHTPTPQSH